MTGDRHPPTTFICNLRDTAAMSAMRIGVHTWAQYDADGMPTAITFDRKPRRADWRDAHRVLRLFAERHTDFPWESVWKEVTGSHGPAIRQAFMTRLQGRRPKRTHPATPSDDRPGEA